MKRLLARLIIYKNMNCGYILYSLADILDKYKTSKAKKSNLLYKKSEVINDIYEEIHNLLDIATEFGFTNNLWQNYLAFYYSYKRESIQHYCEKAGAKKEALIN